MLSGSFLHAVLTLSCNDSAHRKSDKCDRGAIRNYGGMNMASTFSARTFAGATAALALAIPVAAIAWEPTKPVEFVVPAGTGGGADQMARLLAGIAEKHKLSPRPLIVVNKAGGAGAEGFLDVKHKKGDANT